LELSADLRTVKDRYKVFYTQLRMGITVCRKYDGWQSGEHLSSDIYWMCKQQIQIHTDKYTVKPQSLERKTLNSREQNAVRYPSFHNLVL